MKQYPFLRYFAIWALLILQQPTYGQLPPKFFDQVYLDNFATPLGFTFDELGRMYVWEKRGRVYIVDSDGQQLEAPLLDISEEVTNWQEVGGEDRPIVKLSRETNSGTHVYFLETVVRLGNKEDKTIFSADTLLLPSSEGIIAEVRDNPNAIGYDGLGYVTEEVKMIGLAPQAGDDYIIPSAETVIDGRYPISRHLYMYTRGEPEGAAKETPGHDELLL